MLNERACRREGDFKYKRKLRSSLFFFYTCVFGVSKSVLVNSFYSETVREYSCCLLPMGETMYSVRL